MASRKQFHLLQLKWEGPIGRNSVMGGTIVGDYLQSGGERTIVVKMPKVEKKAARKPKQTKQVSSGSAIIADGRFTKVTEEVTHGA
jgi:hypothetical protein